MWSGVTLLPGPQIPWEGDPCYSRSEPGRCLMASLCAALGPEPGPEQQRGECLTK